MPILRFVGSATGLIALCAAQISVPAGFIARDVVIETGRPGAVRAVIPLPLDESIVALGGELWHRRPGSRDQLLRRLHAGEDFAFAVLDAGGHVVAGELHGGRVEVLDATTGAVIASWPGVANVFAAAPLPLGNLLVAANPNWPAAGANSGIWLLGPQITPRELLPLSGPSGPFLLLANGDLVVAELGPIVPPPPGTARLLRFPAPLVQQALAGAVLTPSQAVASGTSQGSFYGLAADDLGSLYSTDAGSSVVRRHAASSLAPLGLAFDVGPGHSGLWLAFEPGNAPFAPYQPTAAASALAVSHGDWATRFATTRIAPLRPSLASQSPGPLQAGPGVLTLTAAPANGLCAVFAALGSPVAEVPALTIAGLPVWSALPASSLPLTAGPTDAAGTATIPFANPGGFAVTVTLQAIAIGPNAPPALGTSAPLTLQLLP